MSNLAHVAFNNELSLAIAMVASAVLGLLLFLIKVPNTEYSRKISKSKNTIAVCFVVCCILFYSCLRHSGVENYEIYTSLMMFVVTAVSSAILSFSLLDLLEESDNDKFYLNVGAIAIMSVFLIKSFWWEGGWLRTLVTVVSLGLFVIQNISHILVFRRAYRKRVAQIQQYYDEEEDHRIKWIRFCYVIMMLTQMFILVYMLLPHGFMKVYILWYVLFMLYFTTNFISFLGSHKLVLDAFAYKTLSGHDLIERFERRKMERLGKKDDSSVSMNEQEIKRLEFSLTKWVDEKRYREYDKTREEIAKELNTTKEILHYYFTTQMQVDFKTWRTVLRVEDAKNLLLEKPDLSINIIAEMSGFSDRSNFHRQFTKIVGCSPRQWRESAGKQES